MPIPNDILQAVAQNLGLPNTQELATLSPDALFNAWCNWQGFIGWSQSIHRAHEAIYQQPLHVTPPDQYDKAIFRRATILSRGDVIIAVINHDLPRTMCFDPKTGANLDGNGDFLIHWENL